MVAVGVLVDLADGDHAAVLHADVGLASGGPGAVDDLSAPDHQIEHGRNPLRTRTPCALSVRVASARSAPLRAREQSRRPMGTVAVTGSAGGIGSAIVARIRAAGHDVLGVDVQDADVIADLGSADGRSAACER